MNRSLLGILFAVMMPALLFAQQEVPAPTYVPPDILTAGAEAHYKDLAVIETSCGSVADAKALWMELTRNGALISVIASPRRMLGWVPADAMARIRSTAVQTVTGGGRVLAVSYTAMEARASMQKVYVEDQVERESEEGLIQYLEFVRTPKTPEQLEREREREMEILLQQQVMPHQDCVQALPPPTGEIDPQNGSNLTGGSGPSVQYATSISGLIVLNCFFLESKSGTGLYDWDPVVYNRYRNFQIAGFSFWTSFAAKYGRTVTAFWRLYSSTNPTTEIVGEPSSLGEDVFAPIVIRRLSGGTPPSSWGMCARYSYMYDNETRTSIGAAQSVCIWTAYKPTGDAAIWPHAVWITFSATDHQGIYLALDTRYWQALLDPFSAPMRNVYAHEMGHLWGCPDEYADDAYCYTWTYRGMNNINCQRPQPAYGRPGLTMTGFDGIMGWNYTYGTSTATPVHSGILAAGSMNPIRCFSTQPANIPITVKTCDDPTGRTYYSTMCLPIDFDFCQKTWVPVTRTVSGTLYYFDHWEVKRKLGSTTTISWVANELKSSDITSTRADPVTDIKAVYTSTPPDYNTANTSLEAWLAPADNGATPGRAIALRWRNKYDMSKVVTKVEYERTPGSWVELLPANIVLSQPFSVPIGSWTGVKILSLPSGTSTIPIAANTSYKFRIVGYYLSLRGTVSNTPSVTTRPASPADTTYCYDAYEPNSIGSPRTLTSSGPGMPTYTIEAACPVGNVAGEFSWFYPKLDYYRITVIDISSSAFGDNLLLTLHVRPGSDFRPRFRAQRAGSTTYINAFAVNDTTYRLKLTADGEYVLSVEPLISTYISNDFVDRTDGHFGFGEYTITAERGENAPVFVNPCYTCVRMKVVKPYPGLFVMDPPFDLLGKGIPNTPDSFFDVFFTPNPGWVLDGFGGGFGPKTANPWRLLINQNTKPGEYEMFPILHRMPVDSAELVLIRPDGPTGVFEKRFKYKVGAAASAFATVPSGYVFVGWSGDTASTANPLAVTMWRSKKLIAMWRQVPCVPEPMTKWLHRMTATNARQGQVTLDYGMDAGAGDGLESGQPDLPPIPVPGTFDVRWINITGSEGSTTDLRAIQQSFTYTLRVQTGSGTAPVTLAWGPPATSPNASYTMNVEGADVDMRTTTSHVFSAEGSYFVKITVKAASCPPPSQPNPVTVTPVGVNTNDFPCIWIELLIRDRTTGKPLPYYDPHKLSYFQRDPTGNQVPALITAIVQKDTTLLIRICSDRTDDDPNHDVQIVQDPFDPDKQKDTIKIPVTTPVPPGQGKLARFVRQNIPDWDLISLPLDVSGPLTTSLFTDPTTKMFLFDPTAGAYYTADSMEFGRGYWIKTTDPTTTFIGFERKVFTWTGLNGYGEPYGYGWNLIGSITKPLAVSLIQQTPAGCLRSIFGWNPSTGYVVPSTIEPSKGYWARVNPGATLKMEVTSLTGGSTTTMFERRAQTLPIAGRLVMQAGANTTRSITISGEVLSASDVELLQLPMIPPQTVADLRTAEGTGYAVPGVAELHVQAPGMVTFTLVPEAGALSAASLTSESGEVLATFDPVRGGSVTVPVFGSTTVLLRTTTKSSFATGTDLGQNYPNPFTSAGETIIPFRVASATPTSLIVTDMLGRTVRTLLDARTLESGSRYAVWDGRDDAGRQVPAGVYLYRLETDGRVLTKSLSIVR